MDEAIARVLGPRIDAHIKSVETSIQNHIDDDCCDRSDRDAIWDMVEKRLREAFTEGYRQARYEVGSTVIDIDEYPRIPTSKLKPFCDDPARTHDGFLRKAS